MLTYQILEADNILVIEPQGPLVEEDFTQLTRDVDAHLIRTGSLAGVLVHAKAFPGWENFGGFASHLRFVRDHHQEVRKVAIASDSAFAAIAPKLGSHFIKAEIRGFDYDEREKALAWLRAEN